METFFGIMTTPASAVLFVAVSLNFREIPGNGAYIEGR